MASKSNIGKPRTQGPATDKQRVEASSRIPNFFRMSIAERIDALYERGLLSVEDVSLLAGAGHTLRLPTADKMIENVIGVFGLPMGVALNFLVNGRDYVVPLAVEEASIVAGLSGIGRLTRLSGGFNASTPDPILIGQVQAVGMADPARAKAQLLARRGEILALANSLHPNMVARGGGARDIEVHVHSSSRGEHMVVLHLLVDTREAMGANLVNTMCEGIAALVETITGGKVFLRILSNLTDRAVATASVRVPVKNLEGKGYGGEEVRDGIVLASDLAQVDPYRATTHNKGIMNGVDALAIATGNDWRAIESAAHAFAARGGRYRALSRWYSNAEGDLVGEIEIPMKVGTVGGSVDTNPSARISHRLLGSPSAGELAGILAAVGLAQNLAALRALATDGIQKGHMTLHARSVATSAGVPEAVFDDVVEGLIESGEIKVWKAREIAQDLARKVTTPEQAERSSACGKVILLGEHSVVYNRPAIALPITLAVEAVVHKGGDGVHVLIPRWGLEQQVKPGVTQGVNGAVNTMLQSLDLTGVSMTIELMPHLPRGMGLGGSAALAVALVRALSHEFGLDLDDASVNRLAFESEKMAHGTPSGIDNTVATYGKPLVFRKDDDPSFRGLSLPQPVPLVLGLTGRESLTARTVARVRAVRQEHPARIEAIFDQMAQLADAGVEALEAARFDELGHLMDVCQGYLNALQVSSPELEELIHIARRNGALGAKLTGGGGGGSMIALCPGEQQRVAAAMEAAGYKSLVLSPGN